MRTSIIAFMACICLALTSTASALECPPFPQQANKDWEVTVNATVGKIGLVKGAELSTRTKSATKDLMSKLPDAGRIYLEQMMFAGYCTALRDDKTISGGNKAKQLRDYAREVWKAISASQAVQKPSVIPQPTKFIETNNTTVKQENNSTSIIGNNNNVYAAPVEKKLPWQDCQRVFNDEPKYHGKNLAELFDTQHKAKLNRDNCFSHNQRPTCAECLTEAKNNGGLISENDCRSVFCVK